jgi:nucleoside-diphosphate-sugar epimerase
MMVERDMRIMRYTILRPSMIYGADRDRNMIKLLKYLSKWPVFPIFGSGKGLMQPVFVQDLADGIVTAILNPELTRWKEYNLCGPAVIPYIDLKYHPREFSVGIKEEVEFLKDKGIL